ncbi:MAG TPA: NYN domain-containing protein [Candidatus Limnocylindrales bacterium]|nr:NYN domain-containing protein [Candidatus Limnocylindrales bacterium]
MGKNVAVFVDVANILYAAKAAGTDIDYVTLLKAATAGRDFVRAYAYTGLDPDNENQRNFHAFLARNHYKVVSKDIRKYGDGKVKANLDIELVVDLMKTARNLDIAIVISGDGDFAPAIRAVQEMGVRVEVISFRGNTSSDLIEVADLFTDITQLARVEKGSSRSGRRVAGDDEDLSMTEVPDKQTEGTGTRGRGRGRGRLRSGEAEPVAARGRTSSRSAAPAPAPVAAPGGNGSLTVLPGEKLARVVDAPGAPDLDEDELTPLESGAEPDADAEGPLDGQAESDEAGRRRRRRRGGRGRGRGRGRDGEALPVGEALPDADAAPGGEATGRLEADGGADDDEDADEADEADEIVASAAPRGPRPTPFGSVWDSQLGVPSRQTPAAVGPGPVVDDEDVDEPEIPEYLIAEQRRGRQPQGRGGPGGARGGARGGRSAYTAAMERERYGRGGGGGINRYPDVSGRDRTGSADRPPERQPSRGGGGGGGRPDAGYGRQDRNDRPASGSRDPWSEVPPELEEMLRAQLAQSGKGRRPEAATPVMASIADPAAETPATRRRPATRKTAESPLDAGSTDAAASPEAAPATAAPKRRTATRKKAEPTGTDAAGQADGAEAAAPRRRTATRKKADPAGATEASGDATADAAPKRRTTRKKADPA